MDYSASIAKTKELIEKAKDVLIVTHEHPSFDSLGSALSIYLGIQSLGKRVTISCPDPVTVELSSFVGANKVVSEFGKNNFIISLDYIEGSIEKVSYNIEGDKFNLVIERRAGFEPFSSDKVHYSNSSPTPDLIIAVDTIHLGSLKKLYESEKDVFASKPIINIDRHPNNTMYGQLNIVDTLAMTTAEVVAHMLSGIGVRLTQDIATNLLNALIGGTDGFQNPAVNASIFEIAAVCMRSGGKRFQKFVQQEETPKPVPIPLKSVSTPVPPSTQGGQAPADWLKPKIFKSSSLV